MMEENTNNYHWTPLGQRQFLECLAETGSVAQACVVAGKSRRAAYNLRFRRGGAAFRIGWDAAILIARALIGDLLMDRVVDGLQLVTQRDPETHRTTRMHYDNRLGMAVLTRLDRMASEDDGIESAGGFARTVSQDFEAFLDLIERGGAGSEAALFVAARNPEDSEAREERIHCELVSNLALSLSGEAGEGEDGDGDADGAEADDAVLEADAKVEAEDMHVWHDAGRDEWQTNFPPPPDFRGEETESFGHPDYQRDLTDAEQEAHDVIEDAALAPLLEHGTRARDMYFGFMPEGWEAALRAAHAQGEAEEAIEEPDDGPPEEVGEKSFLRWEDWQDGDVIPVPDILPDAMLDAELEAERNLPRVTVL